MASPPFNINESIPEDDDIVSQHPANARTFRDQVESYLNTDHDSTTGHHKFATLVEQGAKPTLAANEGAVYTKDDGGDTELYYEDDAGNEVQITADGSLNVTGIPTGVIAMWSGSVASIPTGWALCDGTAGTPDLRDRFIVGAGSTYSVDDTGGATTHDHGGATAGHALTVAEMPAHAHASGSTTSAAGADSVPRSIREPNASGVDGETVGGGDAHTHNISSASSLPPYYALAYIMKT